MFDDEAEQLVVFFHGLADGLLCSLGNAEGAKDEASHLFARGLLILARPRPMRARSLCEVGGKRFAAPSIISVTSTE